MVCILLLFDIFNLDASRNKPSSIIAGYPGRSGLLAT